MRYAGAAGPGLPSLGQRKTCPDRDLIIAAETGHVKRDGKFAFLDYLTASNRPTCNTGVRTSPASQVPRKPNDSLAKPPEHACKPRIKNPRDPVLDRVLASNIVSRSGHSHTRVEDATVCNTVWPTADLRIRPNLV